MALFGECVETEPSSFEDSVQQPIWVDAMVEEYDSIVQNSVWDVSIVWNSVWDVVPRPKNKINNYFTRLGFTKSEADANLYHIMVEGKQLIIILYVDDLILTGDGHLIMSCKEDIVREFKMKDMGLMHYFLGMEVWQKDGELFVSQGKYANEILRRFHMEKCKPMQTPLASNWRKEDATSGEVVEATMYRQLVGSLMYLVNTQPDLCYVVNRMSQAMVQPTKMFWKATKHVFRYLRGTCQYGLWYKRT
eukprot:PITA_20228